MEWKYLVCTTLLQQHVYSDLCMICQHANGDIVKEDLSLLFLGQTSRSAHSILHDPGF